MKSYRNVARYVRERPWAILPGTLEAMLELVELREAGVELEREEVEARIAGGPGKGAIQRAGSVAVLPLYGVITPRADLFSDVSGGTSLETFRAQLDDAVSNPEVKAIALDVNSPGGSTELLAETASFMRAARERKPIVAIANTQAASAAYHLASQATELFVTPSGYVGAIGVYSQHVDTSGAQEKAGVKTTLISAGRFKVEGNPFEPLGEEALNARQELVDAAYDVMVSDIAAGRGVDESRIRSGYGEGRVLDARRAHSEGMVDGVQDFETTVGTLLATGTSGHAGTPIGRNFSDDLEAALRHLDSVVTSAEGLASLTERKRNALSSLRARVDELLAGAELELEDESERREEPAQPADIEAGLALAQARLSLSRGG